MVYQFLNIYGFKTMCENVRLSAISETEAKYNIELSTLLDL